MSQKINFPASTKISYSAIIPITVEELKKLPELYTPNRYIVGGRTIFTYNMHKEDENRWSNANYLTSLFILYIISIQYSKEFNDVKNSTPIDRSHYSLDENSNIMYAVIEHDGKNSLILYGYSPNGTVPDDDYIIEIDQVVTEFKNFLQALTIKENPPLITNNEPRTRRFTSPVNRAEQSPIKRRIGQSPVRSVRAKPELEAKPHVKNNAAEASENPFHYLNLPNELLGANLPTEDGLSAAVDFDFTYNPYKTSSVYALTKNGSFTYEFPNRYTNYYKLDYDSILEIMKAKFSLHARNTNWAGVSLTDKMHTYKELKFSVANLMSAFNTLENFHLINGMQIPSMIEAKDPRMQNAIIQYSVASSTTKRIEQIGKMHYSTINEIASMKKLFRQNSIAEYLRYMHISDLSFLKFDNTMKKLFKEELSTFSLQENLSLHEINDVMDDIAEKLSCLTQRSDNIYNFESITEVVLPLPHFFNENRSADNYYVNRIFKKNLAKLSLEMLGNIAVFTAFTTNKKVNLHLTFTAGMDGFDLETMIECLVHLSKHINPRVDVYIHTAHAKHISINPLNNYFT